MNTMRVGVLAPQIGHNTGRGPLRDVAQAADELGFSSVWVSDHIMIPASTTSSYPYRTSGEIGVMDDQPYYEMLSTLGYLAAVTERVELGTAVAILPYRNPVFLAKALATLDQLSEGRLIFGVGVGWLRDEFEALGADFAVRGKYSDEILTFLRTAWSTQQPVAFHGEHIQLAPAFLNPRPYQDREIPFWIGGESQAAYRRIVRHGNAWFPHVFSHPPEAIARQVAELKEKRARAGRGEEEFEVGLFVPFHLTDQAESDPLEPWRTSQLRGSVEQVRDMLLAYRDAGVTHTLLMFGGRPDRRIAWMQRIRDSILPAL